MKNKSLTVFQTSVLLEITKIPFGETRTYSDIAKAIGNPKAVRAVGSACGKNPLPFFIPCHRVVQSSGKIGSYSMGGAEVKKKLLEFENKISKLN
jgi:O-6-methylguanine DNA methyltransferase